MHRVWRIADPDVHRAVAAELADSELLIADGHHRYETARTYADEIGGDGPHRYTLMALVSLEDPGLTVFGYHRLLTNLDATGAQEALARRRSASTSRSRRSRSSASTPPARTGVGVFGYIDSHFRRGFRLRLDGHGGARRARCADALRGLPRRSTPRSSRRWSCAARSG